VRYQKKCGGSNLLKVMDVASTDPRIENDLIRSFQNDS